MNNTTSKLTSISQQSTTEENPSISELINQYIQAQTAKTDIILSDYISTIWWTKSSQYYEEKFEKEKLEGISSPIDIYDCDLETIQSQSHILRFIQELCHWMWWKMIGETYIKYFDNEDPWITFKQRTDQWIISGHFKDNTHWACLDIHSRNFHDPNLLAEFSTRWFQWKSTELDVSYRPALDNDTQNSYIITQGWDKTTEYYQEKYESKNVWWMNAALDIQQCNLKEVAKFKNLDIHIFVENFILDLCDYIDMVRDWDPEVYDIEHHGKKWLEFTQVITTSLISGHFRHDTKTAYLEIFSCKYYNPNDVAEFTQKYFSGWNTQMQVTFRWIDW